VVFKERLKRALSGKRLAATFSYVAALFPARSDNMTRASGMGRVAFRSAAERRKVNKSWAPGDAWVPLERRQEGRARATTDVLSRWDGDELDEAELEALMNR
jgi:hypothetical protein